MAIRERGSRVSHVDTHNAYYKCIYMNSAWNLTRGPFKFRILQTRTLNRFHVHCGAGIIGGRVSYSYAPILWMGELLFEAMVETLVGWYLILICGKGNGD